MLFDGQKVRIGKNGTQGLRPYSSARAQFFPIQTDPVKEPKMCVTEIDVNEKEAQGLK